MASKTVVLEKFDGKKGKSYDDWKVKAFVAAMQLGATDCWQGNRPGTLALTASDELKAQREAEIANYDRKMEALVGALMAAQTGAGFQVTKDYLKLLESNGYDHNAKKFIELMDAKFLDKGT